MRPARATLRATVLGLALALGSAHSQAAAIRVQDDRGRAVVLAEPARRAVTLAPHATEAGLRGWRRRPYRRHHPWQRLSAGARALPVIGDGTQPDAERVTAVRPDLIIAWQPAAAEPLVRVMDKLGVPVYYSDPQTLADIPPRWNGWASCSAPRTGARPAARRCAKPAGRAPCRPPAAAGFHPGRAGSHLHAEPDQYRQRRPALVRRRQRLRRLRPGGAQGRWKACWRPGPTPLGGRVAAGRQGEQPRGVAQAGLPAAQAGHTASTPMPCTVPAPPDRCCRGAVRDAGRDAAIGAAPRNSAGFGK